LDKDELTKAEKSYLKYVVELKRSNYKQEVEEMERKKEYDIKENTFEGEYTKHPLFTYIIDEEN